MQIDLISKVREELESGRKGILILQTAFLGDVILATPLIKGIKRVFPKARLTVVVIPQCRELVEGLCDQVITIDKKSGGSSAWSAITLQIADSNIGIAFIPHRSFRSGRLVKDTGVPVRIGFAKGGGRFFHTLALPYEYGIYEGHRNLSLLTPFTSGQFDPLPEIKIEDHAVERIQSKMAELNLSPSQFVVIAPSSIWKTKAWPPGHYREYCELIKRKYDLHCVAVGSMADNAVCAQSVLSPELNLAGQLSLIESAALMRYARLVVSGDSAAAHLATVVKSRQLIIFGSTAPRFGFSPPSTNARCLGLDLLCRPCTDHGRQKCPLYRYALCLQNISPEMVLETTNDWLELNEETAFNSVDNDKESRYL